MMSAVAKQGWGRRRTVDKASLLVGLLMLHCSTTATSSLVPRLDPNSTVPTSVLFKDVYNKETNYTFKLIGKPEFKGCYTREGFSSWENISSTNYFNCSMKRDINQIREFVLAINIHSQMYKSGYFGFLFENEAGFLLHQLEIRESGDLIPKKWLPYIVSGVSFSACLLILVFLVLYIRSCRRRCHTSRRQRRRHCYEPNKLEREAGDVNEPQQDQYTPRRDAATRPHPDDPPSPPPTPARPHHQPNVATSPSTTPRGVYKFNHYPRMIPDYPRDPALTPPLPLPKPLPPPPRFPCRIVEDDWGYIHMHGGVEEEGEEGVRGSNYARLTDMIHSELGRLRTKHRRRPWRTLDRRALMESRRMSRSVPWLCSDQLTDNPPPGRAPPPHPMMQPPRMPATIGYRRGARCRPPLGDLRKGSLTAADTDLSWEDGDTLSDLGSVSQSARKPWGRVILHASSARSEESDLDDDDSEVDDDNSPEEDVIPTLQRESDSKYITMSRFVHDAWQEDRLDPPCGLTPAHGAVTGSGPVYMNMLDIFGERYDKGGDGT